MSVGFADVQSSYEKHLVVRNTVCLVSLGDELADLQGGWHALFVCH